MKFGHAVRSESWQPGQLHPNPFPGAHYRTSSEWTKSMLEASMRSRRSIIIGRHGNWSARSTALLYERLALSKDKKGLMRLAKKGEIQNPVDVFKGSGCHGISGSARVAEACRIRFGAGLNQQPPIFSAGIGKGFAFVSRQERITLDGDHFYI